MLEQLRYYFSFSFVWYALIVGICIALASSLMGVTLVLKKQSFIGDTLSHVAFVAMSVGMIANFSNNMTLVLPITIFTAILVLNAKDDAKIKGDSMLALISTSTLAFGYLIINRFSTSANVTGDVCATLFGSTSILTLKMTEVILSVVLSMVVVVIYVMFYNRIFAVTFDEPFLKASGMNTKKYNLLMSVLIASIITLGMKLVGSLLISALIIFPAITSMQLFTEFKKVVVSSALISVFCAAIGILGSIFWSTPVGCTIIGINVTVFIISLVMGQIKKGVD